MATTTNPLKPDDTFGSVYGSQNTPSTTAPANTPATTTPGALETPGTTTPSTGSNTMLNDWYESYLKSSPTVTGPRDAEVTNWNVDSNHTVQGLLQGLLSKDNPLWTRARSRGLQTANSRGMLNTSQAIRDSEGALYDVAIPIAQSDAEIYARAAEANARAANETSMFNAGQTNEWGLKEFDRRADSYERGQDRSLDNSKFSRGLEFDRYKYDRDFEEKKRQFDTGLGEEKRQFDTDTATKLKIAGMDYDIADRRLTMDDRNFLKELDLKKQAIDNDMAQFAQKLGLDRDALAIELKKVSNQDSQFYSSLGQDDRQFYDKLKLSYDTLDAEGQRFNKEWENRFTLQGLEQAGKIDLAKLDAESRASLVQLEGQFKTDIANNQNISGAWATMVERINATQNNPDLEPEAKKTIVDGIQSSFRSYVNMYKAIDSNLDFASLLDWGVLDNNTPTGGGNATTKGGTGTPGTNPNGLPADQLP